MISLIISDYTFWMFVFVTTNQHEMVKLVKKYILGPSRTMF